MHAGRRGEAEPLYREALAGCREALGHGHYLTLHVVSRVAKFLRQKWQDGGRADATVAEEAVALFRLELGGQREVNGAADAKAVGSVENLVGFLTELGRGAEAEAVRAEYGLGERKEEPRKPPE